MTKGAGSPANRLVFFSRIPETTMAATPMKYAEGATHHSPPKKAPAISATMGILAPQGIKVVVIMVILRSLSFSMVRDAMIPGTPQPVPISMGIKDLPDRPNLRKILSMINATLAMYPQASRMHSMRKRTNIWGTKPMTAPTPPTMPSTMRPVSQSAQPMPTRKFSTAGEIHSPKKVSLVKPVTMSPMVETEM